MTRASPPMNDLAEASSRTHDAAGEAAAGPPASLGAAIRRRRKEVGLTLRELAGRTGLSVSFLSQVERNLMSPSVGALKRIGDALGIPAGRLMFDNGEAGAMRRAVGVVRRDRRKRVAFPGSSIRYELITPDLRGPTSVLWLEAAPGAESGPSFSHDGEDGVYVLRGRLSIEIAGAWSVLEAGDSVFFNSALPHRWVNDGSETAEALWISTPPSF